MQEMKRKIRGKIAGLARFPFNVSFQTIRARLVVPVGTPPMENGAVVVNGSRIHSVSRWKDLNSEHCRQAVDLGESVLLPGFVNGHCHLDYTAMSGQIPPPRRFVDWLQNIVAAKSAWSRAQFAKSWVAGAQMLEQSGVTSVLNIESVPELLPEVWRATALRLCSCLELIDARSPQAAKSLVRAAIQKSRQLESMHGNRCGLSPHALYTATDELLLSARDAARSQSRLLTTHVAESAEEDAMYRSATGPLFEWLQTRRQTAHCGEGSPVSILNRLGYFCAAPVVAAHVNYLAPEDERILAKQNVAVAHCPRNSRYFGHAPFPWRRLRNAGVNIALGTDSLASTPKMGKANPRLDFFAELACLADQKDAPDPHEILQFATMNGAKALRRENELGRLSPGFLADAVAIPYAGRTETFAEAVVYHRGGVSASMIHGRWIHQNGDLPANR